MLLITDNTLQESIDRVIGYVNTQNQMETTTLTLVAGDVGTLTSQIQILSNIHGQDCSNNNPACQMDSGKFPVMWDAINGKTGVKDTQDYDAVTVLSAYSYSEENGLGIPSV